MTESATWVLENEDSREALSMRDNYLNKLVVILVLNGTFLRILMQRNPNFMFCHAWIRSRKMSDNTTISSPY